MNRLIAAGIMIATLWIPTVGIAQTEGLATISVSGTAVVRTTPDVIVWQINIADTHTNLHTAKQRNDEKIQTIFALREELAIAQEDLNTGPVRLRRVNKRDERGNETDEFKHFAVSRSVTIRQRDMKRFDEFLEKLVASAEMNASFQFESSRLHDVRAQTRLEALRLAKEKATAMAKVVDAQIGKPLKIDEHSSRSGRSSGYMGNNSISFDPGSRPTVDVASGTSAPGAIEVRVTVYATFELQ